MYVRLAGLLLLVFILSSVLPAYGFYVWSSGGSMPAPSLWRYWFVVLDDFFQLHVLDSCGHEGLLHQLQSCHERHPAPHGVSPQRSSHRPPLR